MDDYWALQVQTYKLADAVVGLLDNMRQVKRELRERDVRDNQKACAYIANYVQTEWVPEEDTCITHTTGGVKVLEGVFTQEVAAALAMRENNKRRGK